MSFIVSLGARAPDFTMFAVTSARRKLATAALWHFGCEPNMRVCIYPFSCFALFIELAAYTLCTHCVYLVVCFVPPRVWLARATQEVVCRHEPAARLPYSPRGSTTLAGLLLARSMEPVDVDSDPASSCQREPYRSIPANTSLPVAHFAPRGMLLARATLNFLRGHGPVRFANSEFAGKRQSMSIPPPRAVAGTSHLKY